MSKADHLETIAEAHYQAGTYDDVRPKRRRWRCRCRRASIQTEAVRTTGTRASRLYARRSFSEVENRDSRFAIGDPDWDQRSLIRGSGIALRDFHGVDVPLARRELAGEDHPLLVGRDVHVRLDAALPVT